MTASSPQDDGLGRTGRFAGGLIADVRRRLPWYGRDFRDGFHSKVVASVFFIFFACLAPAVAFGGLMALSTGGAIGAVEMIVATAGCGVIYALFSGQPLTVLGGTGPLLVFTSLLHALCRAMDVPFLPTYAWVGLWVMVFCVSLGLTDLSYLIRYFTRFTDEIFAALISVIFIVEAISQIARPFFKQTLPYDSALLALLLATGTYYVASGLAKFRQTAYLRPRIREFLADFGPAIAIISMTVVDKLLHQVTLPPLAVPAVFGTTSGRPWLVDLFSAPRWVWLAAAGPALVATLLVYLDQQITARLVNSPEHRLTRGPGYHLDLTVVGLLIGACSLLGLPWLVAATVRSLNHVRSLATYEEVNPSEAAPRLVITSVRENRLSGLLIHTLVGLSLLVLPLLRLVPMAVLFGLFLFMGVASMRGNQLFERLRLWVTDPALYPRTHYLHGVPFRTAHLFTLIQLGALILLWLVKASRLGILFPVFVALLVPLRFLLGRYFAPEVLARLDAHEAPADEEELRRSAV